MPKKKQKMLVLDYEPDTTAAVRDMLTQHSDVTFVDSLKKVAAKAKAGKFDVIITGYLVPAVSGKKTVSTLNNIQKAISQSEADVEKKRTAGEKILHEAQENQTRIIDLLTGHERQSEVERLEAKQQVQGFEEKAKAAEKKLAEAEKTAQEAQRLKEEAEKRVEEAGKKTAGAEEIAEAERQAREEAERVAQEEKEEAKKRAEEADKKRVEAEEIAEAERQARAEAERVAQEEKEEAKKRAEEADKKRVEAEEIAEAERQARAEAEDKAEAALISKTEIEKKSAVAIETAEAKLKAEVAPLREELNNAISIAETAVEERNQLEEKLARFQENWEKYVGGQGA